METSTRRSRISRAYVRKAFALAGILGLAVAAPLAGGCSDADTSPLLVTGSGQGTGGTSGSGTTGGSASTGGGSTSGTATSGGTTSGASTGGATAGTTGGTTSGTSTSGGDAGTGADAAPVTYGAPFTGSPKATKIQGGFQFLEGPLWLASEGKLLFTDPNTSTIHQLVPPSTITVFRAASGAANGLAVDATGRLVACEGGRHRVARTETNGATTVLATTFENKQINASNDLIVRSDGTVYFTDPKWGADEANRQTFQGVYRITPAGAVNALSRDMTNPNGITLSPDEKTLYVDDDLDNFVRAYAVNTDGSVGTPRRFTATSPTPDGMAMDLAGNLYVATQAGVEVFKPDATKIGTITADEQPSNVSFGGTDKKTLFITARTGLYSVHLDVPGKP